MARTPLSEGRRTDRGLPLGPLFLIQFLITIAGSLAGLIFSSVHNALSFAGGGFFVMLNFALLAAGWWLIFQKKWVALAVFLIVIKYAISGIIIYHVVREAMIDPLWFAMGLTSFVATILVYTQRQHGV